MDVSKVVIGLVGTGAAGTLHAKAYRGVVGLPFEVKTVCSLDDGLESFAREHGIPNISRDFQELLDDEEINTIDIAVPPNLHVTMIRQALRAGKYVICEKPLTGFFETRHDDGTPVSKSDMYDAVVRTMDELREEFPDIEERFMYAENIVYAAPVLKTLEFLRAKKSKILFIKGEESHNGSLAAHANQWKFNGGGSLIRVGCHPLSVALMLKQTEGELLGEDIRVKSVLADMGVVTSRLKDDEKGSILARPVDLEDIANVIITFTDGSKANICAGDCIVGGVKNPIEIYTQDSAYLCNIAANDMLKVYQENAQGLDDIFYTPKLGTKLGWQPVFLEMSYMRGYIFELTDFISAILGKRKPMCGFTNAYDSAKVIYAAYLSDELGQRVEL
ncbi:MAG: Gfo/Idh/MocA family oxidoreductase [Clostridiales bacterium]|nr:Gfo/Idh/MocA family oxidoreductase [Clostridiales bacterium]